MRTRTLHGPEGLLHHATGIPALDLAARHQRGGQQAQPRSHPPAGRPAYALTSGRSDSRCPAQATGASVDDPPACGMQRRGEGVTRKDLDWSDRLPQSASMHLPAPARTTSQPLPRSATQASARPVGHDRCQLSAVDAPEVTRDT
jgi:hypothetical protein